MHFRNTCANASGMITSPAWLACVPVFAGGIYSLSLPSMVSSYVGCSLTVYLVSRSAMLSSDLARIVLKFKFSLNARIYALIVVGILCMFDFRAFETYWLSVIAMNFLLFRKKARLIKR